MDLVKFATWAEVLAYAHRGGRLYYQAPLDVEPTALYPTWKPPLYTCRYWPHARTIRIWPPGSVGRGKWRTADPFTADKGHLDRFSKPKGP